MTKQTWECWAYVAERGSIVADSCFVNPDRAWQIGLGWPDEAEIQAAKQRGARVVKVRIEEIGGNEKD